MMNVESTKDQRVWHSGPPPFVGWWNASNNFSDVIWRWWDGEYWSVVVRETDQPNTAAYYGGIADQLPGDLMWNDYWPEDAVCPRLNPDQSSTIWKGKVWAWVDGELVSQPDPVLQQVEEFRRFALSIPSLKTIACPNHKFVDTKAIQTELQNISVELAAIEDKVANIVYCIGRVRKVLRGE